jgi:hypothetical protein
MEIPVRNWVLYYEKGCGIRGWSFVSELGRFLKKWFVGFGLLSSCDLLSIIPTIYNGFE